jgi:hypothetical protein
MVFVKRNENGLLIVSPFTLLELWIKMVHESFSTLLSLSPWQVCGNLGPLSTIKLTLIAQNVVLFRSP